MSAHVRQLAASKNPALGAAATVILTPAFHPPRRWSAVSRTSRYRTRCGTKGAGDVDASNPLPERVDPITLEAVVSPAISPYGHVMGAATWRVRFLVVDI